ncbi:MAG TPA: hypothetical protein VLH84_04165 [Patescibacteria group bacterium]|nr:hypothetical protein [Patescibacteria group bacterium]
MFGQQDDNGNPPMVSSPSQPADGMLQQAPAVPSMGAPINAPAPSPAPAQPADQPSVFSGTSMPSDNTPPAPGSEGGNMNIGHDDPLSGSANADELLDIKQNALQQLSPLVGHLDQTPEEKFRTNMMMIQAADNPALIKEAYAAAQQISDEKIRAQALLDIVNEINYFTQHQAD